MSICRSMLAFITSVWKNPPISNKPSAQSECMLPFRNWFAGKPYFLLLRDSPTHAQETWLFILIQSFFFGEAVKHKLAHSSNCKINLKDVWKLLPWPYFVPRAGRREPWERGCDNKPAWRALYLFACLRRDTSDGELTLHVGFVLAYISAKIAPVSLLHS